MADQRNASDATRLPAAQSNRASGSVTQTEAGKPRPERASEAQVSTTIDVDALARRLERLLPELGAVRVVTSYARSLGVHEGGVDLVELTPHQAKRVLEQLLLLSELRAGLR